MVKSYTVANVLYPRQKDLDAVIKQALNRHALDRPFEDALLAAVVNELHPEVRAAGQRVMRFEYLSGSEQERRGMDSFIRYRGKPLVMGYFEPIRQWFDVTVYPHRKPSRPELEIKRALRERASFLYPKANPSQVCEARDCQEIWHLEYDHVNPTFDEIAQRCLSLMNEKEIVTRFGYSKFVSGKEQPAWCIPDDHPAIRELERAHQKNLYRWLCPRHHRNVK